MLQGPRRSWSIPYGLLVIDERGSIARTGHPLPAPPRRRRAELRFDELFNCRASGGPSRECLALRAALSDEPLPDMHIDTAGDAEVTALWVTAAPLEDGTRAMLHLQPGDRRNRAGARIRTVSRGPTWGCVLVHPPHCDSAEGRLGGRWLRASAPGSCSSTWSASACASSTPRRSPRRCGPTPRPGDLQRPLLHAPLASTWSPIAPRARMFLHPRRCATAMHWTAGGCAWSRPSAFERLANADMRPRRARTAARARASSSGGAGPLPRQFPRGRALCRVGLRRARPAARPRCARRLWKTIPRRAATVWSRWNPPSPTTPTCTASC